jgi:hypothetical protein
MRNTNFRRRANLRELMERMGHSSTKAALVYLHSTSERQHAIANAVGKQAKAALRKTKADKADTRRPGRRRHQLHQCIWHESGTPSRASLLAVPNTAS